MGKVKQQLIEIEEYLYNPSQGLPTWKAPISASRAMALRNANQHLADREPKCGELWELAAQMQRNSEQHWEENMPDLMGEALAQAEMDFLATTDLTAWEQLELDLWEGQHGINEQTYWDVAGRGQRG